jgi:hypothetical protein
VHGYLGLPNEEYVQQTGNATVNGCKLPIYANEWSEEPANPGLQNECCSGDPICPTWGWVCDVREHGHVGEDARFCMNPGGCGVDLNDCAILPSGPVVRETPVKVEEAPEDEPEAPF